jgi:hypothetical protein
MLKPIWWISKTRRFQAVFCSVAIVLSVLLIAVGAKLVTSKVVGMSSRTSKSAYIDKSGKTVIDVSRYEAAGDFSDGLAPVEVQRQGWGFIDKTGALAIAPKFESTLGFKEGLAPAVVAGKWGFINKDGTLVIENQYDWVAHFSEGVAIVERPSKSRGDSEFLVIDTTGQILANLDEKKLSVDIDNARFSEGLLAVFSQEKKARGYINKSWEFVIQPQFAWAAPFSEGLARVAVSGDEMEKLGFIDNKGNFVVPPAFNTDYDFKRNSSDFSEGLAALSEGLNPARTKAETFVYLDKLGQIVLATEFFYAGEFHDGLAIVYNAEQDRWGYIDQTGKVVIPVEYQSANDFSEGLALVTR